MKKALRAQAAPTAGLSWPIRSAWGNGVLLFFAVLVVYWPALSGEFLWDDHAHVTRPELRTIEGLFRIWNEIGATQQYYPLLHTAFWIEYQLWGEWVVGYHLTNVIWHAGAAVLLGTLLRRLEVPGAWWGALLFAVHPVCVESVAWISEQKNTLSLLLYLAAANLYLGYVAHRKASAYLWATVFFVLALLTKTVTATLPAALLVVLWWRQGRIEVRKDVLPLLPWFILGVGGGLLTAWLEHTLIGAQGEDFILDPVERLLLAGRVVWFYAGKLLWPYPLIFIYPRWNIDAASWSQYLFPLAALAVLMGLMALVVRLRLRAPLAVALIFGGTLVPVLGFINVFPFLFSFVADHFQYHASPAFFAGVAAGLALLSKRVGRPLVTGTAALVLVLILCVLSWRQAHMYKNNFALYETTLARNPAAWMAHTNLGIALVDSGRAEVALPHYRTALDLRPRYPEGENNLGFALSQLGRNAEALPHLRKAVELKPDYPQARNNLARTLMAAGRTEEGLAAFREMKKWYPNDGDTHFNLGLALARSGRTDEALACFEQAVRLNPRNAQYVLHVGTALKVSRRFEEAETHYRRAIELDPDSALVRLTVGRALFERGRYADAVDELRAAARLDNTLADIHHGLAAALHALGRAQESDYHAAKARQLQTQAPR